MVLRIFIKYTECCFLKVTVIISLSALITIFYVTRIFSQNPNIFDSNDVYVFFNDVIF